VPIHRDAATLEQGSTNDLVEFPALQISLTSSLAGRERQRRPPEHVIFMTHFGQIVPEAFKLRPKRGSNRKCGVALVKNNAAAHV
jgi:hypothetical protein